MYIYIYVYTHIHAYIQWSKKVAKIVQSSVILGTLQLRDCGKKIQEFKL